MTQVMKMCNTHTGECLAIYEKIEFNKRADRWQRWYQIYILRERKWIEYSSPSLDYRYLANQVVEELTRGE